MGLPVGDQMKYWGIVAAIFFVLLWVLGDVLVPFVLGGAIAYFLDPVADRLERLGASRMVATAIITVSGVLVFVLMALLVVPNAGQPNHRIDRQCPAVCARSGRFPDGTVSGLAG